MVSSGIVYCIIYTNCPFFNLAVSIIFFGIERRLIAPADINSESVKIPNVPASG